VSGTERYRPVRKRDSNPRARAIRIQVALVGVIVGIRHDCPCLLYVGNDGRICVNELSLNFHQRFQFDDADRKRAGKGGNEVGTTPGSISAR